MEGWMRDMICPRWGFWLSGEGRWEYPGGCFHRALSWDSGNAITLWLWRRRSSSILSSSCEGQLTEPHGDPFHGSMR